MSAYENKSQSPNPKESSRYSPSQQLKLSESSYIINESENDKEEDRENALKKSVSWNMEGKEETEICEESKKIMIEAIDEPVETPQEIISEGASEKYVPTNYELMNTFDPSYLREISHIKDVQPIRASCFNNDGDYFVVGTNSKSLKICSLHNIVDGLIYNEQQGREQYIDIVFEMHGVHIGSVYCVD